MEIPEVGSELVRVAKCQHAAPAAECWKPVPLCIIEVNINFVIVVARVAKVGIAVVFFVVVSFRQLGITIGFTKLGCWLCEQPICTVGGRLLNSHRRSILLLQYRLICRTCVVPPVLVGPQWW